MKLVYAKTDEDGDKQLSFFICAYVLSSSLNIAIKTIFSIPESAWSIISYGFEAVDIIALIIAVPVLFNREKTRLVLTEAGFGVLYLFSFLFNNAETPLLVSTGFWTFAVCIPICIAGIAIYDKEILFKYLQTTAFIEFPVLCIAIYTMRSVGTYSMSSSYALVLPILFLFYQFFENRRVIALGLGILGVVLVALFGARGPFLCIALYVTIKLFTGKNTVRNMIIRTVVIVSIALLLIYWNTVLDGIQTFLQYSGINSYALRRLINGQITESQSRETLQAYYINEIGNKPIFGYGLMGGWLGSGEGPHNMLLEFLLAFGIPIGSIVCIYAVYLLIASVFKREGKTGETVLILAAYNFTMYLVSGNWLAKPLFFLYVALTINMVRESRKSQYVIKKEQKERLGAMYSYKDKSEVVYERTH